MKYVALIPSYEPDEKLIKIVKELKHNDFDIVVVNDGSSHEYKGIFDSCESLAKVINYDVNMGKGYAIKKGLSYIKENYDKCIIVTVDSDGQHTVKDTLNLCHLASENKNVIFLGKRVRGKNTPIRSKVGNIITRFFFYLTTGNDIYDTQTGLRAFDYSMIPFLLKVNGNRFDYEMNVLLDASKNNIGLKEEIIDTIYENNNKGSHFKAIRDSYLIYKQIFKFLLSSFSSFIIDYLIYFIMLQRGYSIIISNVTARLLSANYNYFVNKSMVFNNKEKTHKTIFKYYFLAIVILLFNNLILSLLVNIGINKYISKVIVEIILFIFNWIIQKRYIF